MSNSSTPSAAERVHMGQSLANGDTGDGITGVPADEQGISNRPGDHAAAADGDADEVDDDEADEDADGDELEDLDEEDDDDDDDEDDDEDEDDEEAEPSH